MIGLALKRLFMPTSAKETRLGLLDFDFAAGFFEGLLGFFGCFLSHSFQESLRRAFDKRFRIRQSKPFFELPDHLNASDLLVCGHFGGREHLVGWLWGHPSDWASGRWSRPL